MVCRNNLRGERRTESADLKEHTSCEGGARLYSRRVSSAALCAAVFEEEHRKGSRVDFFPAPAPRHVASTALCCVCVIGSKSSTLSATKIGGSLGLVFIHERLRATVTALSRLHEVAETSEDAHDDDGADEETEDDVAKDVDIVLANVGLRLLDRRDGREERGKDECGLRGRGGGGGGRVRGVRTR